MKVIADDVQKSVNCAAVVASERPTPLKLSVRPSPAWSLIRSTMTQLRALSSIDDKTIITNVYLDIWARRPGLVITRPHQAAAVAASTRRRQTAGRRNTQEAGPCRRRSGRRIACRASCGWCSCRSSNGRCGSVSRSSSWACSSSHPSAEQPRPGPPCGTPSRRPSTRWRRGWKRPAGVRGGTATAGLDRCLHSDSKHCMPSAAIILLLIIIIMIMPFCTTWVGGFRSWLSRTESACFCSTEFQSLSSASTRFFCSTVLFLRPSGLVPTRASLFTLILNSLGDVTIEGKKSNNASPGLYPNHTEALYTPYLM